MWSSFGDCRTCQPSQLAASIQFVEMQCKEPAACATCGRELSIPNTAAAPPETKMFRLSETWLAMHAHEVCFRCDLNACRWHRICAMICGGACVDVGPPLSRYRWYMADLHDFITAGRAEALRRYLCACCTCDLGFWATCMEMQAQMKMITGASSSTPCGRTVSRPNVQHFCISRCVQDQPDQV